MSTLQPVLLPFPRRVHWGTGGLAIPGVLPVAITSHVPELTPTTLRFKNDVETDLGITVEITASIAGLQGRSHVHVVSDAADIPVQGYQLIVDQSGIYLRSGTAEGAAYGLATLKQLLLGSGRRVPEVHIEDYPDFRRRGIMLDISRGKVPTMETLYQLVNLLADLKINEFQLYTEHTFAYRDHSQVWRNYSPITGEQIISLDRYCEDRFIDLVPNQNSFGHLTPWLVHGRYQHLAETLEGFELPWGERQAEPFSLCPVEPKVIPFLRELYNELLPHFTSGYFHVGCDETWDVGQGRSRDAVQQHGKHRVYLDFLRKVHGLVQAHGRTMQFWGDMLMEAPELLSEVPGNTIAMEWGYEAHHSFADNCPRYAGAGLPFYVCPGTSTWNSLVGRTDNALANMRAAAESGLEHGAMGFLATAWGDRGHQDYQPMAYLPIAYGAAVSWAVAANRDADARPFLNRLVFADENNTIGGLLFDLGNVYQAVGLTPHNASVLGVLLHRGFQPAPELTGVTAEGYDQGEARIHELAGQLADLRLTCRDATLVQRELRNAIRMLVHACHLGRLRLEMETGHAAEREHIQNLARDLDAIMAEHRHLWLARNRIGGLEEMSLAPLREIYGEYQGLL